MSAEIRVLVVDDHEVMRQGLRRVLELEPDMHVVGEASDGQEALNLVQSLSPDIILMDLKMPTMSGLEAMQRLKRLGSIRKVIVLSFYGEYFIQALELGVGGYLVKDVRRDELVGAIRLVHQGELVLGTTLWPSLGQAERTVSELQEVVKNKSKPVDGGVIVELRFESPVQPAQFFAFLGRLQRDQDSEIVDMVGKLDSEILLRTVLPSIRLFRDFLSQVPEVAAVEEEAVSRDVGGPFQHEAAYQPARVSDFRFRITLKS